MKYKYLYASFILTLVSVMFTAGLIIVFTALQKYTCDTEYVLFYMDDKLSGFFLNYPYKFDISNITAVFNRLAGFVPNTLRAFALLHGELEAGINSALDYFFY